MRHLQPLQPGYQRTLLSDFYYKESADTSSEEKRLSFTAGLCERNAGDGPADGTAVFITAIGSMVMQSAIMDLEVSMYRDLQPACVLNSLHVSI